MQEIEKLSTCTKIHNKTEIIMGLERIVQLDYKRMIELFHDFPLTHYLLKLAILPDKVLFHYFHCEKQARVFFPYQENF